MREDWEGFWMVLGRGVPTYRHATRAGAESEAQRLAQANPEERFYVLGAETAFISRSPVERHHLEEPVPF